MASRSTSSTLGLALLRRLTSALPWLMGGGGGGGEGDFRPRLLRSTMTSVSQVRLRDDSPERLHCSAHPRPPHPSASTLVLYRQKDSASRVFLAGRGLPVPRPAVSFDKIGTVTVIANYGHKTGKVFDFIAARRRPAARSPTSSRMSWAACFQV